MQVSIRRMDRVVSGSLMLAAALWMLGMQPLHAANIAYTLTNFNEGNLNLSDVIRAVNFHATDSFVVTINGQTATFESSGATPPAPFTGYVPVNALLPTYTNVAGNSNLAEVIRSHAFVTASSGLVSQMPLTGLTPGSTYEIQLFFHDGRTTGCAGTTGFTGGCGNRTVGYGDQNGISTPQVTRNSGTIAIGTFTADSTTQMVAIGGGDWDLGVSGYVLRSGVPLVLGDTDGDGTGGEFPDDFEPIRANFRNTVSTRAMGDLVGNGVVDFADFRQWKAAHLAAGGSLQGINFDFGTTVPEPSSFATGSIAFLAIATMVRIYQRNRVHF
jgi:hypothetical protein